MRHIPVRRFSDGFFGFIRSPLLIVYVICLHLVWGPMLVLYPKTVPPLVVLGGFQHYIELFGAAGAGFIITTLAILAACGLTFHRRLGFWLSFWLLMPQYAIALLAALTCVEVMVDGITVPPFCLIDARGAQVCRSAFAAPWQQIVLGTIPIVISGALHTAALLARWADRQSISQLDSLRSENLRLHRLLTVNGINA